MTKQQIHFFEQALKMARKARAKDEVPVGALIVKDGVIISKRHNQSERDGCFTSHAEMLAIKQATRKIQSKYLTDCDMYVTLEPCHMCRAAAKLSRIKNVFYLGKSHSFGSRGKGYFKTQFKQKKNALTHLAIAELQSFFRQKR